MPVKKYKPQSPDPYVGKIKGDTEFARLAHLNDMVDQVNTQLNNVTPGLPVFLADVSTQDYNAVSSGIYTITDYTPGFFFSLPSPASLVGQTIYIINPTLLWGDVPFSPNIPISFDGTNGGSSVSVIATNTAIQLISTGGIWMANKYTY